ncbi:MAG: EpsG family protein [Gammaproteobacteria bacterium]|uniref:EpsG family protein n=1 Tax=endosymbiont of Bathymodiolus septemdierum str. Myojin knoll TaxID=1303921 RepID=A0A0P0URP3_9GAMM|nr:EpsG family protein [Bathymodiolus septemdierum thioautotrophic gill symbiont]RUA05757.1 MAG: EpsG family protein [Gammaproteobacteria bacterium]BAS67698.1 conserved hypothetical protein [endosymbiont of Bathymodiolus septemdierum str. Myojin knoll]
MMVPYIFFYLFILSIGLWNTKKTNFKYSILFFSVFIFSAFRFDVGYDYENYYRIILDLTSVSYTQFESIPRYAAEFSNYSGFTQLFFIFTSYVIVYSVHYILKNYSKDYFLSLLIFISIPYFYLMSFSVIRQYCAVAIVFYGIKYIFQRNFFLYVVTVILASMFHYSAIITIVIYFLNRINLSRFTSIVLVVTSFFVTPILFYVMTQIPRYAVYASYNSGAGVGMQLFLLLMSVVFIFFCNSFKTIESRFYYNVFIVGVCTYNAFIFVGDVAARISYYFIIYLILLIPELQYRFKKKQFYFVVILFSIFMYSISFYLSFKEPTKNFLVPYQLFLFKDAGDLKQVTIL